MRLGCAEKQPHFSAKLDNLSALSGKSVQPEPQNSRNVREKGSAISPRAQTMDRESKAVGRPLRPPTASFSPLLGQPPQRGSATGALDCVQPAAAFICQPAGRDWTHSMPTTFLPISPSLLSPAAGCGTKAAAGCTHSKACGPAAQPLQVARSRRERRPWTVEERPLEIRSVHQRHRFLHSWSGRLSEAAPPGAIPAEDWSTRNWLVDQTGIRRMSLLALQPHACQSVLDDPLLRCSTASPHDICESRT